MITRIDRCEFFWIIEKQQLAFDHARKGIAVNSLQISLFCRLQKVHDRSLHRGESLFQAATPMRSESIVLGGIALRSAVIDSKFECGSPEDAAEGVGLTL